MDWIHMIQVRDIVADYCDHGNKPLGSMTGAKYLN
jgi:hypothetical protein